MCCLDPLTCSCAGCDFEGEMSDHLLSVKLLPTISYEETISLIFGRAYMLVSCNVQNIQVCVEPKEVTCNMLHSLIEVQAFSRFHKNEKSDY